MSLYCECGKPGKWWMRAASDASFMAYRRVSCDDHLGPDIIREVDVHNFGRLLVWSVKLGGNPTGGISD